MLNSLYTKYIITCAYTCSINNTKLFNDYNNLLDSMLHVCSSKKKKERTLYGYFNKRTLYKASSKNRRFFLQCCM